MAASTLAAALTIAVPAQAAQPVPVRTGTFSYTSDDEGDYIGGGGTGSFSSPEYDLSLSDLGNGVIIDVNSDGSPQWTIDLEAGSGNQLTVGQTYFDTADLSQGLVHVEGEGRVCDDSITTGDFTVTAFTRDRKTGQVKAFSADFTQHCNGAVAALHGTVHWQLS